MITLSSGNLYYSQKEIDEIKSNNNNFVNMLKKDFNSVSIALRNEAEDRDWCEEYNEFVENINTGLVYMKLLTVKKDYEVKVKIEETRQQYVCIKVEALCEDEALEIIDAWDYSEIFDYVNEYNWESTDQDTETIHAEKV